METDNELITRHDSLYSNISEDSKLYKLRQLYNKENENETKEIDKKENLKISNQLYEETSSTISSINSTNSEQHSCKLCFNKTDTNDNYIILSCNHIFHIKCLAEIQFNDIYKFHVIDEEYFKTRKCMVCNKLLQTEELLFLHSKFLNNTKNLIENHDLSIKKFEKQLSDVKEELRICYNYKHKLQHEREKSKQIVNALTSMI
jgi:hypothetical protein